MRLADRGCLVCGGRVLTRGTDRAGEGTEGRKGREP